MVKESPVPLPAGPQVRAGSGAAIRGGVHSAVQHCPGGAELPAVRFGCTAGRSAWQCTSVAPRPGEPTQAEPEPGPR